MNEPYCLDATALIDVKYHYPKALKKVSRQAKQGRVVIAEGVFREICRKSDRLKEMVRTWRDKYNAVIRLDTRRMKAELRRIDTTYGPDFRVGEQMKRGFWKSKAGKGAFDAQVVTVSKVNGYIVVSNDEAIQDVCQLEDVSCIGWQEFYRRMERGLTGQEPLFDNSDHV